MKQKGKRGKRVSREWKESKKAGREIEIVYKKKEKERELGKGNEKQAERPRERQY